MSKGKNKGHIDARSGMDPDSHEWFCWWMKMIIAKENASLKAQRRGELETGVRT